LKTGNQTGKIMVYHPTAKVLAVLELLQTYGQMNGFELARRLEVDVRTVRRYVTTLQDIGIPIDSIIGRYGGYALRPGFKLPPLMFNDDEVLVLTLGLLLARRAALADAGSAVQSALAKVERVLPLALRERLRALQEAMRLEEPSREALVEGDILTTLSVASSQGRQVRLRYASPEGETERVLDPYAVLFHQERWYTVGYCHLRGGLRVFRLDRMREAAGLETRFSPPENFDAFEYMLNSFEAIPDEWNVDVLLDTALEAARQSVPRSLATLVQEGNRVRLRASIRDLDDMARTIIRVGCPFTVLHPPELRDAFCRISEEIMRWAAC
jgi:predicted DNA-binding transcriptional regulator YafY